MRAFAEALDSVPVALAENSGLSPIETLAAIKSQQVKDRNARLGVDCMQTGSNGMCLLGLNTGIALTATDHRYARTLRTGAFDLKTTAALLGNSGEMV